MLSPAEQFKYYQGAKSLGEPSIAAEYIMVIDGYEHMKFIITSFPLPITSPEGVIDVPMVGGSKVYTPQIARVAFQGGFSMKETTNGTAQKFYETLANKRHVDVRPVFNFTIYQGTEDYFTNKYHCIDATAFGAEPPEVNFENPGALLQVSGQIAYHYFPGVGENE